MTYSELDIRYSRETTAYCLNRTLESLGTPRAWSGTERPKHLELFDVNKYTNKASYDKMMYFEMFD